VTAQATGLAAFGWDESWAEAAAAYPHAGMPGRVIRVDRGLCSVLTAHGLVRASIGGAVLDLIAADALAAPCTGDWVMVREWPDGPLTIEVVLDRRTSIIRAESSKSSRPHLLAANADFAGVVVGLHPDPNIPRLERLLTVAWQSGATPLIILTKADIVPDGDDIADDVRELTAGVEVFVTSTRTGDGVDALRAKLANGATLALLGASGHGKSSLTNALVGADHLLTKKIRDDGKGRHTSVRRELVLLPGGGAVIDTPGLRSVGLHESNGGMEAAFPEIARLAEACRFKDCTHTSEPGCAVQEAVASGAVAVRRLDSWRALQAEREAMAKRTAIRLRHQERKSAKLKDKHRRSGRKGQP
jgi:ribosome biogenesis GTPase